jgi:hypothetical protein
MCAHVHESVCVRMCERTKQPARVCECAKNNSY